MIDIFNEINRMEREMDLLCNSNHCVALMPKVKGIEQTSRLPVADMYETESNIVATFELPGVDKEEIQLDVTDKRIEVKVERKSEKRSEEKEVSRYELKGHKFYGALPIPRGVVAENAEASYKNGVLRIEIPKAQKQVTSKRIEIK